MPGTVMGSETEGWSVESSSGQTPAGYTADHDVLFVDDDGAVAEIGVRRTVPCSVGEGVGSAEAGEWEVGGYGT